MSEGEVYCIMNLEKYADFVRKKAASSFSEDHKDLDGFVTIQQAVSMVKENSIGIDEDNRHLIDDEAYEVLFEAIKTRIHNSGLSKLASQGHLECAWDDEKNEMVFWSSSRP